MTQGLHVGAVVRLKNRPAEKGQILEVLSIGTSNEPWYRVRFDNGARSVPASSLVVAEVPNDPQEQLLNGLLGGPGELRLLRAMLRLTERNLTDQLRSLRAARLQHFPYQYKPLLKLLESERQCVLIADEVGLGKTIEAGIIYSELLARHELNRVLVLAPANLGNKWKSEFAERFGEDLEIRDLRWVRDAVLDPIRDGRDPPPFRAVCSLEGLRRLAKDVEELTVPLDLLIVDEAHRLRNEGTQTFKLGRALAQSAEAVVLCSATPIQTSGRDLHNLLRILLGDTAGTFKQFELELASNRPVVRAMNAIVERKPRELVEQHIQDAIATFGPARAQDSHVLAGCERLLASTALSDATRVEVLSLLQQVNTFGRVLTRTRRRDVFTKRAIRVAREFPVTFTAEERDLYNRVTDVTRELTKGGKWTGASFTAIMRQRQAASCLAAFIDEVTKGKPNAEDRATLAAEVEMDTSEEEGVDLTAFTAVARDAALPTDSKLAAFLDLLGELRTENAKYKAVVFSTFRGTVRYLARKLSETGIGFALLTGEIADPNERWELISRFRTDAGCHVLLSTEVGAEGIDLQFCNTIVNYDLPWNPMAVEQRIGRLDRIGQAAREIRIFNLNVLDTVESRILGRLFDRIHVFVESIGPLEAILGERIQKLSLELAQLSVDEQEQLLEREAFAIEMQKADAARLDAEATNLLGDDAYYQHRLAQIEKAQGDIADDLRVFVDDFLRRGFKRAGLLPDERPGRELSHRMTFDSELATWLSDPSNRPLRRFRDKFIAAGDDGLSVTFRQEAAEQFRGIEFLTSTHPFVRAIVSRVEERREAVTRAFAVDLRTKMADPGWYLLGIGLQAVDGLRPRKEIVEVGINLETGEILTEEAARSLIVEAERGGLRCAKHRVVDDVLSRSVNQCEQLLVSSLQRRATLVSTENTLLLDRRRDALERWYKSKLVRSELLAESHPQQRVRRMHAGLAEKWRTDLRVALEGLSARELLNPISDTKALVLIHVDATG